MLNAFFVFQNRSTKCQYDSIAKRQGTKTNTDDVFPCNKCDIRHWFCRNEREPHVMQLCLYHAEQLEYRCPYDGALLEDHTPKI